jgi:hypothetical protein
MATYSDDPDLHGLTDLVQSKTMEPLDALQSVATQWFERHVHDVTPDVRDPQFWKLVAACIVHTATHEDDLAKVIALVLKLVVLFK